MIDIGNEHFVDAREVVFLRAMPADARGKDRVDVVLRSGFLFCVESPTFEAAQGLLRNIRNQIKPYHNA
jgi:hypothetical protein